MPDPAWPPPCHVAELLAAFGRDDVGGLMLEDLLCFRHLKKWTTALFARHWDVSEDTAARALHRLHEHGLLGCLQGEARTAKGAHHGGRGPDTWFLTPCGARVISAHLGLDPGQRVREPVVGRGAAVRTASGVWKHKDATPQARTLIAHDLACVEVALREGCLDPASNWVMRRQVRFTPPYGELEQAIVPDFAIPLVRPAREEWARPAEHFTCYVEIEGTSELAHIAEKHRRYAALVRSLRHEREGGRVYSRAFATELVLILVLNFGEGERKQRQTALRRHRVAYANRRDGDNYELCWIDLDDLLAAPEEEKIWRLAEPVDYRAERDRLRAYWDRQPGSAYTGDYER